MSSPSLDTTALPTFWVLNSSCSISSMPINGSDNYGCLVVLSFAV
jgi:hypothetical protein